MIDERIFWVARISVSMEIISYRYIPPRSTDVSKRVPIFTHKKPLEAKSNGVDGNPGGDY